MISVERLKEVLNYSPETGLFTWKIRLGSRTKIGAVAGSIKPDGYVCIEIDKVRYKAHRLAWLYVYEEFPELFIDHINGDTGDNRISNLRLANHEQNMWNSKKAAHNTSGYKGVHFNKNTKKWRACAWQKNNIVHIGLFETKEKAHEAYVNWCVNNRGSFMRVN